MQLDDDTVLRFRWRAQLLDGPQAGRSALDVVTWFGALQSQAPRQVEWAIGVRADSLTRTAVRAAFHGRRIVRTWAMRGTIHAVPAVDAPWMIEHLARRQLVNLDTQLANSGLDPSQVRGAIDAIADGLAAGPADRTALRDAIAVAVPDVTSPQVTHLVKHAAHHAVLCPDTGPNGEQRFVPLDAIAPHPVRLDRSEALARIAERYLASHGPATDRDLARWAGITLTDARRAIAELDPRVTTAEWNGSTVHLPAELADSGPGPGPGPSTHLLPAFDEHVIGYADRQPNVPVGHDHLVVQTRNAVYQPTIAHDGRTVGTWKPANDGGVEVSPFDGSAAVPSSAVAAWKRFDSGSPCPDTPSVVVM